VAAFVNAADAARPTAAIRASCCMYLSFESVCAKRTDAWGARHTELAVSYRCPMLRFLGLRFGIGASVGTFRAHWQLERAVAAAGWDQPLWWRCDTTTSVTAKLAGLSSALRGNQTTEAFLAAHPPSNSVPPLTPELDYEGFVAFFPVDARGRLASLASAGAGMDKDAGASEAAEGGVRGVVNLEWCALDYEKLKTELYYFAHKPKPSCMSSLMALSALARTRLPAAEKVFQFYTHAPSFLCMALGSLTHRMERALAGEALAGGAGAGAGDELLLEMQPGARVSLAKQPRPVKFCMLVNCSKTAFQRIAHAHFCTAWPSLPNDDAVHAITKKIVMTLRPWEVHALALEARVQAMLKDKDEAVLLGQLLGLLPDP